MQLTHPRHNESNRGWFMAGELGQETCEKVSKTLDNATLIYETGCMTDYRQAIEYALPTLHCRLCGHKWHPRKNRPPERCAKCDSRCWYRERRDGKNGHN